MSIPGPAYETSHDGDQSLPVVSQDTPAVSSGDAMLPVVGAAAGPLPESAVAALASEPVKPETETPAVPGPELLASGAVALPAAPDTADVAEAIEKKLSSLRRLAAHLSNPSDADAKITALRDQLAAETAALSPTALAAALLSDPEPAAAPHVAESTPTEPTAPEPAAAEPSSAQAAIAGAESPSATLPGALAAREPHATPSTEVTEATEIAPVQQQAPSAAAPAKPESFVDAVGGKPAEGHAAEQSARAEDSASKAHQVA